MPKFNMNVYNKKEVPIEKDFGHNEELRKQIFAKIEPVLNAQGIQYTEEQKQKIINNPEKLALFNKAMLARDRVSKQKAIYSEFKNQYKMDIIPVFARLTYALMKVPSDNATKEEIERIHKENLDTYLKYSDPRNVEKLTKEAVDYCLNYDITRFINLEPEKGIDIYFEDSRINFLFCIDSMLSTSNGDFVKTDELGAALAKIKSVIENGNYIQTACNLNSSALAFLLPEELTPMQNLMLYTTVPHAVKEYIDNGYTGFFKDGSTCQGMSEYFKKNCAKVDTDQKIYDKYMTELTNKYGKDFIIKYDYQGSSIGQDINKIAHVDKILEIYDLMDKPDLDPIRKEQYETMFKLVKEEFNLKNEKDNAKVKAVLEDYKKNFTFTFVKKTEAEIENTYSRIFKSDNLAEMMFHERADFLTQKAKGKTTLTAEINALVNKQVTKKDTSDLLRVYAEAKSRIDNRKWYSYFAFWNISKQNDQLRSLTGKIIESGNHIAKFEEAYQGLKNSYKLDSIRSKEGLEGSNYVGREAFNKYYTVQSERIEKSLEGAKEVHEKLVDKALELIDENTAINQHIKEIDDKLEKMYAEDPELKDLVENGVRHNANINENEIEKNDVNNDFVNEKQDEQPNLEIEK